MDFYYNLHQIKSKFSNFDDVAREKKRQCILALKKKSPWCQTPTKQKHCRCLSKNNISRDILLLIAINNISRDIFLVFTIYNISKDILLVFTINNISRDILLVFTINNISRDILLVFTINNISRDTS